MINRFLIIVLFLVAALIGSGNRVVNRAGGGGGGGGPDISEDFEGTGTPAGWTVASGSPNFDQSTAGLSLAGSECLYIAGNSGALGAYVAFTPSDSCFVYFVMRFENNPTSFRRWCSVKSSTGTSTLLDGTTGTDFGGWIGIDGAGDGTAVAVDTTVHVWVEYIKGTGSNAIKRLYISTTGTKPGSPSEQVTNGTETGQAARFYFETWASGGGNAYYDTFRLSRTTPLGDNGT